MDWNRVEGNWKEVKGQVKEKWAKLTNDDLTKLTANAINSKADYKSGTAMQRTKPARMLIRGFPRCRKYLVPTFLGS